MKLAAEIELPFSEFWELTPYEFNLKVDAYYNNKKEKYKKEVELAYMNAYWTIQWLGKKKPEPLNKIIDKIDKEEEKKIMTDEQMLAMARVLNVLCGGEEIIVNP